MNDNPVKTEDVTYIKEKTTTYEVVRKYTGKNTLLELLKGAIKRDIEAENFENMNP
jgi:hypothetical protein